MANITFNIPDSKINEFKTGFLRACPVPTELVLAVPTPLYTENEWIKEWGRRQLKDAYERGKRLLLQDTAQIDGSIIT